MQKEMHLWLPLIAGIATREEIEYATAEQLSILNEVAYQKIYLMKGGGI